MGACFFLKFLTLGLFFFGGAVVFGSFYYYYRGLNKSFSFFARAFVTLCQI